MSNANKIMAAAGGVVVFILLLFLIARRPNKPEAVIEAAGEALRQGKIDEYFTYTTPLTIDKVRDKERALMERAQEAMKNTPEVAPKKPIVRTTIIKNDVAIVVMETEAMIGEKTYKHMHRQPAIKIDGEWLMAAHYWTTNKELYERVKEDFKAADREAKEWIRDNKQ